MLARASSLEGPVNQRLIYVQLEIKPGKNALDFSQSYLS